AFALADLAGSRQRTVHEGQLPARVHVTSLPQCGDVGGDGRRDLGDLVAEFAQAFFDNRHVSGLSLEVRDVTAGRALDDLHELPALSAPVVEDLGLVVEQQRALDPVREEGRQDRPAGDLLRSGSQRGQVGRHLPVREGCRGRRGGPALLFARRCRRHRDQPRDAAERRRAEPLGRLDHHHAVRAGGRLQGGHPPGCRSQAQGDEARDQHREEVLEGRDPPRLPQHRAVRPTGLRHRVRRPVLLRQVREGRHPRGGGEPRRDREQPVTAAARPARERGAEHGAPQQDPRLDAPPRQDHAGAVRRGEGDPGHAEDQAASAGLLGRRGQLRSRPLLRLRPALHPHRCELRLDRRGAHVIDLDLQKAGLAAMHEYRRRWRQLLGPGRHRQGARHGAEPSIQRRRRLPEEEPDVHEHQLEHRLRVRRIERLPGRLDVQTDHADPVAQERELR
uniref:EF-hand domain-containing protein n=1 Tax=Parastrongyloides trichosuri TaxID=131310 RepID=A0A0N5A302_PARTI